MLFPESTTYLRTFLFLTYIRIYLTSMQLLWYQIMSLCLWLRQYVYRSYWYFFSSIKLTELYFLCFVMIYCIPGPDISECVLYGYSTYKIDEWITRLDGCSHWTAIGQSFYTECNPSNQSFYITSTIFDF